MDTASRLLYDTDSPNGRHPDSSATSTTATSSSSTSDNDDDYYDDDAPSADSYSSSPSLKPRTAGPSRSYARDSPMRRFFRPWRSVGAGMNRRWTRVPNADPGSADDEGLFFDQHLDKPSNSGFMHSLRDLMLSSWLNGLLVFVPIGLLTYIFKMSPILVFITNVIAIVPLSSLLTEATEMIASDAGDTVGALLNISLGNLVELILFVVALVNNHIRIVQASILGSILVNLLPILGSALLASSLPGQNPNYNTNETQLLACLLFVSVFVFLMPTAFDYTYDHDGAEGAILQMSRISALMVLGIYLLYFVHELRNRNKRPVTPAGEDPVVEPRSMEEQPRTRSGSHPLPPRTIRFHDEASHPLSPLPEVTGPKSEEDGIELDSMSASISNVAEARVRHSLDGAMSNMRSSTYQQAYRGVNPRPARSGSLSSVIDISPLESSASAVERVGLMRSGLTTLHRLREGRPSMESNAFEQPVPTKRHTGGHRVVSVLVLILTSALMSMSAEFLVTTIDAVTRQGGLSEAVIGLIILPIVGNIAEYVTVVTVAARNKLDLAIAVAVGSSIQIALCVTPLTVLAGWILHRDLALTFNYFEMATLLGTVLLVNLLILNDGSSSLRTSGLKGALMCACYVIIGLGAYLSPSKE